MQRYAESYLKTTNVSWQLMEHKGTVHTEKPDKRSRFCRFHQFFVDEKNELVNDPLHSWDTVDQLTERKERERKSFNKRDRWVETLVIQLEEDSREKSLAKDTKDVILCVMCTKIHDLEQCKAYVTKFVE